MKTSYKVLLYKAKKLVDKLQSDINNGKRKICENYGQKEIQRFLDKELNNNDLSYSENCEIKEILFKVSDIH